MKKLLTIVICASLASCNKENIRPIAKIKTIMTDTTQTDSYKGGVFQQVNIRPDPLFHK